AQGQHGVDVNLPAEGAGENQPLQLVRRHADLVQQDVERGADGALGFLQLAHVPLGKGEAGTAVESQHAGAVHVAAEAIRETRVVLDAPALVDDPLAPQRGDEAEQAGAGEADGRLVTYRLQPEPAILQSHLHDGAVDGPRAARNVDALKGRTGSGRGGDDALPVGDQHLDVGAQVDGSHGTGSAVEAKVGQAGEGIGANEAADQGWQSDARALGENAAGERRRVPNGGRFVRLEGQRGE